MKHEIYFTREKTGLGHRTAASVIRKAAQKALDAEKVDKPCRISVMLTDDEGIRSINAEFRGIDRATDVLSFPGGEMQPGHFDADALTCDPESGAYILGDMAISLERCQAQGEEFGHGFDREISYLTVHSVLHLLGYDHMDEGEMKAQMRSREKEIMEDEV